MPGFPLVQGFTEARLARGLDAGEAAEIRDFVLQGRATPNDLQAEQLQRLTVLYADYFTPAAKTAWQQLTGLRVDDAAKTWASSAKLYKNVLEARLDLSKEQARIARDFPRASRGTRFLAADVAARVKAAPTPSSCTHAEAVALNLPPALYQGCLGAADSVVARAVVAELVQLEKTRGDGDGVLAPRDVAAASPRLVAITDALFGRLGKKTLSIKGDIAAGVGAALCDVVFSGPRNESRLSGVGAALYESATREVLDVMARDYQRDVVRGGGSFTLFLEKHGIHGPAHKGEVLRALEALVPPPTLKEIAALYALAVDGKLTDRDFYTAARLEMRDLFQLQAEHPQRFPRQPGQKDSAALAAPRSLQLQESSTLNDVNEVAAAWAAEVVTGKVSVEQFTVDHNLRSNVLTRMRKDHPTLFAAPPRNTGAGDADFANDVAAAIAAAAEVDPFAKVPALIERVNEDRGFVAAHGALTYGRYYDVRKKNPSLFGRVDDAARWQTPVAQAVRDLAAAQPSLSRQEIVAELQKTWPAMTYSRLAHLKEADPSLPLPGNKNRRSGDEIDALAAAILAVLQRAPKTAHVDIAAQLSKERGEPITAAYVSSIVRDFRPQLFAGIASVDERRLLPLRHSAAAQGLMQLAIRVTPPGARVEDILATFNRFMSDRGVPPLDKSYLPRISELQEKAGYGGPAQVHAAVAAEIVAEYAAVAAKGASEADILAAVQRDWPTLTGGNLGRYRALWKASPKEHPALAAFFGKDGAVVLVGQGKKRPADGGRFLGGHDLARQLAGASTTEQAAWARLTELAAIPLRLPEVDAVLADLDNSTPLKQANVLWVSHLLADIVPMGFALKAAGAESSRTIVVGTPYGTNPTVKACLEDLGFPVRKPKLSGDDYVAVVERAIDDIIEQHKKNKEPVTVLDDGGLVSHLLHDKAKYAPYRKFFRIVEQTTGGLLLAEKHALEAVVVNVARSRSKIFEGGAIGEVVATKMVQALARFGSGLQGKGVCLIGYGVVGPHLASELQARGARLTIIERNPTRAAAAKKAGFDVVVDDPGDAAATAKRKKALAGADLVVGATGRRTLSIDDIRALKDGAAIASASSKRIELAMEDLERAASSREEIPSGEPLVTLPTARYRLGKKDVVVIGDGFPVNFDGGVQSVPPERIQLTDAAMLAALFQASKIGSNKRGIVDLDPAVDRLLLARHQVTHQGSHAVYDPAQWRDVVKALGAVYDDVIKGT